MPRTTEEIEAEINAVKQNNANWASNAVVLAYITELLKEKNLIGQI
jgi:hypothetical protein